MCFCRILIWQTKSIIQKVSGRLSFSGFWGPLLAGWAFGCLGVASVSVSVCVCVCVWCGGGVGVTISLGCRWPSLSSATVCARRRVSHLPRRLLGNILHRSQGREDWDQADEAARW